MTGAGSGARTMRRSQPAAALAAALAWETAMAQDRMPEIPADKLTEAQRQAAEEFRRVRGVPVFGPFTPLLRSPELMLAARAMGDYLRYKSSLPLRINEFVILITAREWTQQPEWAIHHPIALKAGLDPAIARRSPRGVGPKTCPRRKR